MNSDARLTKGPEPAPHPKLISTAEVADLIGVPEQTIRRWLREPQYADVGFPRPFVFLAGRRPDRNGHTGKQSRFRFDRAEIVRWLESKREVRR